MRKWVPLLYLTYGVAILVTVFSFVVAYKPPEYVLSFYSNGLKHDIYMYDEVSATMMEVRSENGTIWNFCAIGTNHDNETLVAYIGFKEDPDCLGHMYMDTVFLIDQEKDR